MKLTSKYFTDRVYWRTFGMDDTVYVFGHRDGFIFNGQTININHPRGHFQLELKKHGLTGIVLEAPGTQWANDDELVITESGELATIESTVSVELNPDTLTEHIGEITHFFDQLGSSQDQTYSLTNSLTIQTSSSAGQDSKAAMEISAEASGGATSKASGEVPLDKGKIGLEIGGSVSNKVATKVQQELTTKINFSDQVTRNFSFGATTIVVKARTIKAYSASWGRKYRTGQINFVGGSLPFEVTTMFSFNGEQDDYIDIAHMPQGIFEEFATWRPSKRHFPVRQGASLLVDGNGWLGLMKFGPISQGGTLVGSIYNSPFQGTWDTASRELKFTRNLGGGYLQHWVGSMVADGTLSGTFIEELRGVAQPTTFSWRATRALAINGNGYAGEMVFTDASPLQKNDFIPTPHPGDLSISGTIYGNRFAGQWLHVGRELLFTRFIQNNYAQHWKGTPTGTLLFSGTFLEDRGSSSTGTQNNYSWTGQEL